MTCFRNAVGIASAAEDLFGSRQTALMTSSVVSVANAGIDTPAGTRLNVGGGAPLVDLSDLDLVIFKYYLASLLYSF